jgi:argininosuccinate lyase
MTAVDISRLAEEVVSGRPRSSASSRLDDAYSTGSSIMPQKKNPDIAELARGKAGRLIGNLTGLLATLKALPLAYNRDLQEDKEPVFDASTPSTCCCPAFAGMVATLTFDTDRMAKALPRRASRSPPISPSGWSARGCRSGSPTRSPGPASGECEAARHRAVGPQRRRSRRGSRPHLTPGVREVLTVEGSLASRDAKGGTAPVRVREQLIAAVKNAVAQAGPR